MRLAPLLLAALIAPSALATDVKVSIKGFVLYNQIKKVPLDTVKAGHTVTLSFMLDSANFVDGTTTPTRGYVIDPTSFALAFKTTTVAIQSPFPAGETPYFVLRNNDPGVDGFVVGTDLAGSSGLPINVVGNSGNYEIHALATYGGTKLSSLDLLGALGTHDFNGMTVFGFRIEDGPQTPMEIDFDSITIETVVHPWTNEGNALAGSAGVPGFAGTGDLSAGSANTLRLSNAKPGAPAVLVLGMTPVHMPFKGGTLVPAPDWLPVVGAVDVAGGLAVPFTMPAGVAAGTQLWLQWAIVDAGAVRGMALSNARLGVTP